MNPNTITRSIDMLLAHGFIEILKQGGKAKGDPTIYGYSTKWEEWEPGDKIFSRRPYHARGFTKRNR